MELEKVNLKRIGRSLLELPLQSIDTQANSSASLSTRASPKLFDWYRRLAITEEMTPGNEKSHNTGRLSVDKSNITASSPRKSALVTSFSSIFSKFVKTNLKRSDESSLFEEAVIDLKKWDRMMSPRKAIDVKKEFAMRRMKSSTLVVRSQQKVKSSIPLVLQESKPVNHIYVRDACTNLTTQKERTLVQIYAKSTSLKHKSNYAPTAVSKKGLACLTHKVYQNTIDYLKH
mmetsp:Transcript_26822/g.48336  ORF Transcript_26822/g.48336 Transcript_26822/m.48336 type:complete len:231 (-) Transcript_26822:157-849(-)